MRCSPLLRSDEGYSGTQQSSFFRNHPKPPTPGGPVPIPYPNIAKSGDTDKGSKKVKVDGNPICLKDSNFKTSTGDEAGTLKGVASSKNKGKAEFINYSFDVKIEGKNVPRAFDMMLHNDKNTPPLPVLQKPIIALGQDEDPELQKLIKLEWRINIWLLLFR